MCSDLCMFVWSVEFQCSIWCECIVNHNIRNNKPLLLSGIKTYLKPQKGQVALRQQSRPARLRYMDDQHYSVSLYAGYQASLFILHLALSWHAQIQFVDFLLCRENQFKLGYLFMMMTFSKVSSFSLILVATMLTNFSIALGCFQIYIIVVV